MLEGSEQLAQPEVGVDMTKSAVLKEFIIDYLNRDLDPVHDEPRFRGVDISDPRAPDMDAVRANEFEVRDIRTAPTPDGKGVSYHFHMGVAGESRTEVHIQGEAAEEISRRIASVGKVE
jgi:hypothetical protein